MLLSKPVETDPRVTREARTLAAAGHEVHVLHWGRGRDGPKWPHTSVAIDRLRPGPLLRAAQGTPLQLPLLWSALVREGARLRRTGFLFDAVHAHDLDTLPAAARLARRNGCALVYDAHENYGALIHTRHGAWAQRLADRYERRHAPRARAVVAANEGVAAHVRRMGGKDPTVVMNCPDVPPDWSAPPQGPFVLFYSGVLDRSRFLPDLVRLVGHWRQEDPPLRLLIVGKREGDALAAVLEAARGAPNVELRDPVSQEEILRLTRGSHAVCALLDPRDENNRIGTPNKLFEAMAMGRPVVVAEGTAAADIVRREGCGIVSPYAEAGVRDALRRLASDPEAAARLGRAGHAAALREYNWPAQARRLLAVYDDLAR